MLLDVFDGMLLEPIVITMRNYRRKSSLLPIRLQGETFETLDRDGTLSATSATREKVEVVFRTRTVYLPSNGVFEYVAPGAS